MLLDYLNKDEIGVHAFPSLGVVMDKENLLKGEYTNYTYLYTSVDAKTKPGLVFLKPKYVVSNNKIPITEFIKNE